MQTTSSSIGAYRFGIFGFGVYPLGLELSVEASYPADEAAGTALIFLSGQVQGGLLILCSAFMSEDLTPEAEEIEVLDFSQNMVSKLDDSSK